MPTTSDITQFYVDRLASQYRTKVKAPQHLQLVGARVFADALGFDVRDGFKVDSAEGEQLDILGKYVGAPRDVGVPDTKPYFSFATYEGDEPAADTGFTSYSSLSLNAGGQWYEYEFSNRSVTQLPDYSYRQLLKLKIATNQSNNSLGSIQDQIQQFFPGQLRLRDNLDMTATYYYGTSFQLPIGVLSAYLPRPMGVEITPVASIGFDVSVDGVPLWTSDTPAPRYLDFGSVQFASTKTIVITNALSTPISILGFQYSSGTISVGGDSVPVTLNAGESFTFTITMSSSEAISLADEPFSVLMSSDQGSSTYQFLCSIDIEGVFLDWIAFDNLDGYAVGPITSLSDSWGWALPGGVVPNPITYSLDNFESYSAGTVASLTGGLYWAGDASFNHYSNS